MTLDTYFARRFLWVFGLIVMIFVAMLFLIDLIDKMQDFPDKTFGAVFKLVVLHAPSKNYEIMPLLIVLSTVTLFVRLARSSELVVVRAAGRSGLRSLAAPIAMALLIGIVSVTMLNPIVSATAKRYGDLRSLYVGAGQRALVIAEDGLWFRQADREGQSVIHAERASSDLSVLFDTTFLKFDPAGEPTLRINASTARLSDGEWSLRDTKTWSLRGTDNPEAQAVKAARTTLPSSLTHDQIVDSFGKPEYISIWQLPAFIAQLEQARFSARRYVMWFQMELARPLFFMTLVMLSAAFTMRHARLSNTGLSVLSAVILGFGLHYIRNFAQILGENGEIPVILAAWAPPVAALMLATGILLHMEDG